MTTKHILIIAPSIDVKGGISTVVKGHLRSDLLKKYKIYRVSSHKDGNKIKKLFTVLGSMIATLYYMVSKHIDIVHIHGSDPTSSLRKYFLFKLVEPFNCKVIYHFHGAVFQEAYLSKPLLWQKMINYLFQHVDMVICLSNEWGITIRKLIPNVAETVIIENAVSLPEDSNQNIKYSDRSVHLLFLGLIGERKGVFDLLEVISRLKKSGYNIKLSVGGNGEINKLKQSIDLLNIKDMVNYMGWVTAEHKEQLYLSSDIYILPSYGEGMPMSILEGMSYSLPIISTNVGGIPDLVMDYETGFLIEPGDLDALYKKIEILIKDSELRNHMGLNAREKIKNEYDLEKNIYRLDEIYQTLLADCKIK